MADDLDVRSVHNDAHQSGYVYASFGKYNVRGRRLTTPVLNPDTETNFRVPLGYYEGTKTTGNKFISSRRDWRNSDETEVVTWAGSNQWAPQSFVDRRRAPPGVLVGSHQWYQKGSTTDLGTADGPLDSLHSGSVWVKNARFQAPGIVIAAAMQVVTNGDGSKTKFLKAIYVTVDSIQSGPPRVVLQIGCWSRNMSTGEAFTTPEMFIDNASYNSTDPGFWNIPKANWNQSGTEAKVFYQIVVGGIYNRRLKTITQMGLGTAVATEDDLSSYGLPQPTTDQTSVSNLFLNSTTYGLIFSGSGSFQQEVVSLQIYDMGYADDQFCMAYTTSTQQFTQDYSATYEEQTNPANPLDKYYAQTSSSYSQTGSLSFKLCIYKGGVITELVAASVAIDASGTRSEALEANPPSPPNQTWTPRLKGHSQSSTTPALKRAGLVHVDFQNDFYAYMESSDPGVSNVTEATAFDSGGNVTTVTSTTTTSAVTGSKLVVKFKGAVYEVPISGLPIEYATLDSPSSVESGPVTSSRFGVSSSFTSSTPSARVNFLLIRATSAGTVLATSVPSHTAFFSLSGNSPTLEDYYTTPVSGIALAAKQAKPADGGGITFERLDGTGYTYTGFHLFYG